MKGMRFVLLRKEIPVGHDTLNNGEDEQMIDMMVQKGWRVLADKTKPSVVATLREMFLEEVLKK